MPQNQKAKIKQLQSKTQPTHPDNWTVVNDEFTYRRVDEAQENDRADHSPDSLGRTLLKSLCHYLVQAVTHASQLRRKPVKATRWSRSNKKASFLTLKAMAYHSLTTFKPATKLAPFSVNLLNCFQALAKYQICMVIHGWKQWWIQQEFKSPQNIW